MMKTNGVIKGVAKSLNNADFATGVDGGAENDLLEEIDGDMLRTREGTKKPARFHMP